MCVTQDLIPNTTKKRTDVFGGYKLVLFLTLMWKPMYFDLINYWVFESSWRTSAALALCIPWIGCSLLISSSQLPVEVFDLRQEWATPRSREGVQMLSGGEQERQRDIGQRTSGGWWLCSSHRSFSWESKLHIPSLCNTSGYCHLKWANSVPGQALCSRFLFPIPVYFWFLEMIWEA